MNNINDINPETMASMNEQTIAFSKGFFYNYRDVRTKAMMTEVLANESIIRLQADLMYFGYKLGTDAILSLAAYPKSFIEDYHRDVVGYISSITGSGEFTSLFGNFPQTVLDMGDLEFFANQFLHYLSDGEYTPDYGVLNDSEKELYTSYSRCFNYTKYTVIGTIDTKGLFDIVKSILSANQSITAYDKEVVKYFLCNYDASAFLPESIPFKENSCLVAALVPDYELSTTTDILRYAMYLSGGDISLPAVPKACGVDKKPYNFKSFSRRERTDIMRRLDKIASTKMESVLEDMKHYEGKWKRLGEKLHSGEFSKKFPYAVDAFVILRNACQYVTTFNGRVAVAEKSGNLLGILSVLSERPGELFRSIDHVVRKYVVTESDLDTVKDSVLQASKKVSTKVLYDIAEYYSHRNDSNFLTSRSVIAKGSRSAAYVCDLEPIDEHFLSFITTLCYSELKNRFAASHDLSGQTIYIDSALDGITLPRGMRTANKSLYQMPRGSRLPIDESFNLVRFYCRWVDKFGDTDLDLSTTFFSEDMNVRGTMSWNSLRRLTLNGKTVAVFSGDVRHRRGNCAEFIDIDIDGMREAGIRYVVGTVHDFDRNGFSNKATYCGVMKRDEFGKPGDVTWAPETIEKGTAFAITSKCDNIVSAIIDLETRELILVDEDINGIPVATTLNSWLSRIVRRYSLSHAFSVKTLIENNAGAAGASVQVVDSDTIVQMKNKNEEFIRQTTSCLEELSQTTAESIPEDVMKEISELSETLDKEKKRKFVTFDDIAVDYTGIFNWM